MGRFAFNSTIYGINVGPYNSSTDTLNYNGMLYSLECFVELSKGYKVSGAPYYNIQYLSPRGWEYSQCDYSLAQIDYWDEKPYSSDTSFNGIPAISLKMTTSSSYYDQNASYLGVIPGGATIFCEKALGCVSGATHKDWLRICGYYYAGNYTSVPNNCAFVDTGIASNSMSPRVRGSW